MTPMTRTSMGYSTPAWSSPGFQGQRAELRAYGPQRFTVHINPEMLNWLSLSLALHTITDILYRQPLMTWHHLLSEHLHAHKHTYKLEKGFKNAFLCKVNAITDAHFTAKARQGFWCLWWWTQLDLRTQTALSTPQYPLKNQKKHRDSLR